MKNIQIEEILVEDRVITKEQLKDGISQWEQQGREQRLGEVLLKLGYLTERQLLKSIGGKLGLEVVRLEFYHVDERAVEKIPKRLAFKYTVIAVAVDGKELTVATADPLDLYALEDLKLVTGMELRLILAEQASIRAAIELNYSGIDARDAAKSAGERTVFAESVEERLTKAGMDEESPIVRLLNSLLLRGYNTNVSDIHLEPAENGTVVRMRRDGMLLPYMTLPRAIHQGLVARIKILAKMDIAEKRRSQDGHFFLCLEGRPINIRVSFVPTIHGEKGVLRYLNTNTLMDRGKSFGMSKENFERMKRLLLMPNGMIYLTGPTGCGKTTTLYAVLRYLSAGPVNIMTIEDPVENFISGISQIEVNERAGVTFESGLRALLRQDPDILMIGETRDAPTARLSARASITGHLVLSTLHTNDAASAVTRLFDMGLERYLIAESLTGVAAQRLVRKICPHCKNNYEASVEEKELLLGEMAGKTDRLRLWRGNGCYLCSDTGYRGRIGIHEILAVDSDVQSMIVEGYPTKDLKEYGVTRQGMTTLCEEARKLVLAGITTVEEMKRITYSLDGIGRR